MTMTLVAIVYESKEDIPSTLTELYQMFVELLSGKWDENRNIASPYDSNIKLAFLSKLAWRMHSERLESISQDRCIELADEFFKVHATIRELVLASGLALPQSFAEIKLGRDKYLPIHSKARYYGLLILIHKYSPTLSSNLDSNPDEVRQNQPCAFCLV